MCILHIQIWKHQKLCYMGWNCGLLTQFVFFQKLDSAVENIMHVNNYPDFFWYLWLGGCVTVKWTRKTTVKCTYTWFTFHTALKSHKSDFLNNFLRKYCIKIIFQTPIDFTRTSMIQAKNLLYGLELWFTFEIYIFLLNKEWTLIGYTCIYFIKFFSGILG